MQRDTDPAAPKAGEQLRDFDGRDVHCPECERSRWANTGPKKKASRSAGLKLWREYGALRQHKDGL